MKIRRSLVQYGGDAYVIGDVLLLACGGMNAHWYETISGIGCLCGALIYSKAGNHPGWFAFSAASGIPFIFLANLDGLATMSLSIWVGSLIFCLGQTFGALSAPLSRAFADSRHTVLRQTLGQPRRLMGITNITGKAPLLFGSYIQHHWSFVVIFGLWMLGDAFIGVSSLPMKKAAFQSPA